MKSATQGPRKFILSDTAEPIVTEEKVQTLVDAAYERGHDAGFNHGLEAGHLDGFEKGYGLCRFEDRLYGTFIPAPIPIAGQEVTATFQLLVNLVTTFDFGFRNVVSWSAQEYR